MGALGKVLEFTRGAKEDNSMYVPQGMTSEEVECLAEAFLNDAKEENPDGYPPPGPELSADGIALVHIGTLPEELRDTFLLTDYLLGELDEEDDEGDQDDESLDDGEDDDLEDDEGCDDDRLDELICIARALSDSAEIEVSRRFNLSPDDEFVIANGYEVYLVKREAVQA